MHSFPGAYNEVDGSAELREILPPALPGAAFHFNKRVPRRGPEGDAEDLRTRLEHLEALLAEKRGKADRRSAVMQALVQELDRVRSLLGVCVREASRGDGPAGVGDETPRPHSQGLEA